MTIKLMVIAKRKSGLSPEQFRDGYENSHSRIAVHFFGHLWTSYKRNYAISGHNFAIDGQSFGTETMGFDAISEFEVRDEAALAEMGRISAENYELIKADEALWFDQLHSWLVTCETISEHLAAGA